jgi:hypothetical protein
MRHEISNFLPVLPSPKSLPLTSALTIYFLLTLSLGGRIWLICLNEKWLELSLRLLSGLAQGPKQEAGCIGTEPAGLKSRKQPTKATVGRRGPSSETLTIEALSDGRAQGKATGMTSGLTWDPQGVRQELHQSERREGEAWRDPLIHSGKV